MQLMIIFCCNTKHNKLYTLHMEQIQKEQHIQISNDEPGFTKNFHN